MRSVPEGIQKRHQKACSRRVGGRCDCSPTWQAQVWSARDGRRLSRTFKRETEARAWRRDAVGALSRGELAARGTSRTLRQAEAAWRKAAAAGVIRTAAGNRYKPATLRSYADSMRLHVLGDLGAVSLADVRRTDLQRHCERMLTDGASASKVRNAMNPIRAIYRHAISMGELTVNPTSGLALPTIETTEPRIAAPKEIGPLLAALPSEDRALWATAFYTGLRRGEMQALRWSSVDMKQNVIGVRGGWDAKEGEVAPKSKAGKRDVPLPGALRPFLAAHRLATGRRQGLVFGRTADLPFTPDVPQRRADKRWTKAKLERINLHGCRHTYASLMIAAGVNAKTLQRYMGHASITVTLDLYGHLFPGAEAEAAKRLDSYLAEVVS